jgi:two-component system response regulator AlgR
VIVDDEAPAVEALEILLRRGGGAEVVGVAGDGEAALQRVAETAPDVVFLDIGMPGLGGLAVARALAASGQAPRVVFVTAYDRFAAEAFDLSAVDYVLKPVDPSRLDRALERVTAALGRAGQTPDRRAYPEWVWAPSRGGMARLAVRDVQRIEAERDYVRLSFSSGSYLLRRTLAQMESQLDPGVFVRAHRSVILRAADICGLRHLGRGAWAVVDAGGRETRIGRRHLAALRARLGVDATGRD